MSRLEVHLLGGFDVSCDGEPIKEFESQKVRALLAYLIVNRQVAHSRDRLAGLLWPDKDEEMARQNLRQAVYNLRNILPRGDSSNPLLLTTHKSVQFNPDGEYWLDVAAFEEAVRRGMAATGHRALIALAEAAELYRGDFLAGFFVKGSLEFEHWLFYEQERLREMAVQTLRRLIDDHLTAGAYRHGIRYARRLLELDPLFEEAHRKLMRLYALSGRRTRALAQYEEYRALLQAELGVEPLEETTALYQAILTKKWPVETEVHLPSIFPGIPFTGRAAEYATLRRAWDEVKPGSGRVTLIEGEAGVGKTRLVEEFLGELQREAPVIVLRGCTSLLAVQRSYDPIAQALRDAAVNHPSLVQRALSHLPETEVMGVACIVPELRTLYPGFPTLDLRVDDGDVRRRFYKAVARFLEVLVEVAGTESDPRKLVLFLDDLHWAPRPGLELFAYLVQRLARAPVWVLGTYRSEAVDDAHPLHTLTQRLREKPHVACVALQRFDESTVAHIAADVVGRDQATALAEFLYRSSGGLPLALTELLNYLADEGILIPSGTRRWKLRAELSPGAVPSPESVHELITWRVSRLPASARRLLVLAAVMGPVFEVGFLGRVAGEQQAVVNAGVKTWLKRGMVRELPPQSIPSDRLAHGVGGHGQQQFLTFAHGELRQAIYADVNVRRRQIMHRQVAEALEREWATDTRPVCELIVHHYIAAGTWGSVLPYLKQAAEKARHALDFETALRYYDQALEVLEKLENTAATEEEQRKWLRQRLEVLATHAELCRALGREQQRDADVRAMQTDGC